MHGGEEEEEEDGGGREERDIGVGNREGLRGVEV